MQQLFELTEDAMVRAADGKKLGEIERYVVNPSTREVSHVVVKEGLIFKNHRVVPVEMIDHVDNEGPVLSDEVEPDDLPPYETEHYVPVDDVTRGRFDDRVGEASMWRYPTLATGFYPGYPGMPIPYRTVPQATKVREENVPSGSAVIDEKTAVESPAGETIGHISEVVVDDEGGLSHLVVDFERLDGERVVPGHWIDTVRDDAVVLAVGDSALERLHVLRRRI